MANELKIRVQARDALGKHARKLRAQGMVPGNISGGGKPSTAIQMDERELKEIIKTPGAPILRISVEPGGGTDTALLARVERDAVSTAILHADFRRVVLQISIHGQNEVSLGMIEASGQRAGLAKVPAQLDDHHAAIDSGDLFQQAIGTIRRTIVDEDQLKCVPHLLHNSFQSVIEGGNTFFLVMERNDDGVFWHI